MSDAEKVSEYMAQLKHPLMAEIEALRSIIKQCSPKIGERIKWNAPSYYCPDDFVTFNLHLADKIRLIFHHPSIIQVKSDLLEGDYKDRRIVYFQNMEEINAQQSELERIVRESVALVENKGKSNT